jgi:hypothetical protein
MPTPDASAFTRQNKLRAISAQARDGNQKVYTHSYQPTIKISSLANFLPSISKIPRSIPIRILSITDIATDDGYGTYVLNANTTIQSNEILNVNVNLFVPQNRTLTINGTYNLTYTDDIVDWGTIIINGTFIVNVGTRYFNERSTVRNNGTLIVRGRFNVDKRLENKQTITIISGGRVNVENTDTLINDGTINIGNGVGSSRLSSSLNSIITNNGTVNVGNGTSQDYIALGAGTTFTNNGTINVASNSYLGGMSNFVSNPSVVVQNGTVNLNGNAFLENWSS